MAAGPAAADGRRAKRPRVGEAVGPAIPQPQAFAPPIPRRRRGRAPPQPATGGVRAAADVWARSAAEFGPLLLPQLRLLVDRLLQDLTLGGQAGRTPLMVVSALSGLNVLARHMPQCLGPPPRDSTGRCWRRRRPRTRLSESSRADESRAGTAWHYWPPRSASPPCPSGSGRAHTQCVTGAACAEGAACLQSGRGRQRFGGGVRAAAARAGDAGPGRPRCPPAVIPSTVPACAPGGLLRRGAAGPVGAGRAAEAGRWRRAGRGRSFVSSGT